MSKKILIIDDDLADRTLVKEYLSEADPQAEFLEAENGEDGLKLYAQGVDLIVLDVVLPGEDGFSICQKIKKDNPQMKVIMLTGAAEYFEPKKGEAAGADIYTTKSIMEFSLKNAYLKLMQSGSV